MIENIMFGIFLMTVIMNCGFGRQTDFLEIQDYQLYIDRFTLNAGDHKSLQMSQFSTQKQLCANDLPCKYYIYLYEPSNKSKIQKTVLMTSGMHGNQRIGPTTLLYIYPIIKTQYTRLIYFPICNPSGYIKKTRNTYPNNVDLNRDFPIDDNYVCYLGTSTRILDHLYRMYKIDLTLNLHNGGDQIGWNWGTISDKKNFKTSDEEKYKEIGQMLAFYGGSNQLFQMKAFKLGTMTQSIYPATGTFDDWAYGGSWHNVDKAHCNDYQFQSYSKDMHNGLMLLFELGMHQTPMEKYGTIQGLLSSPNSTTQQNGYVSRAIRILKRIIKIIEPQINIDKTKRESISIQIQGCSTINSFQLAYSQSQSAQKLLLTYSQKQIVQKLPFSHEITIKKPNLQNAKLLQYQMHCDKKWQKSGNTSFSKPRIFKSLIMEKDFGLRLQNASFNLIQQKCPNCKQEEKRDMLYWIQVIVPIFLFLYILKKIFLKRGQPITNQQTQVTTQNIVQGPLEHKNLQDQTHENLQVNSDEEQ